MTAAQKSHCHTTTTTTNSSPTITATMNNANGGTVTVTTTTTAAVTTTSSSSSVTIGSKGSIGNASSSCKKRSSACCSDVEGRITSNGSSNGNNSKMKLSRIVTRDDMELSQNSSLPTGTRISIGMNTVKSTSCSSSSSSRSSSASNVDVAGGTVSSPKGVHEHDCYHHHNHHTEQKQRSQSHEDNAENQREEIITSSFTSALPQCYYSKQTSCSTPSSSHFHASSCPSSAHIAQHIMSLRYESLYYPMRTLLHKLWHHPLNRNHTFTHPVDPLELNLPDYDSIISHPMCFRIIKERIQSGYYIQQQRQPHYHHYCTATTTSATDCMFSSTGTNTSNEVERAHVGILHCLNDMKLVLSNAILYNPVTHPIHIAAKGLQSVLLDGVKALYQEVSIGTAISANSHIVSVKGGSLSGVGGGKKRKGMEWYQCVLRYALELELSLPITNNATKNACFMNSNSDHHHDTSCVCEYCGMSSLSLTPPLLTCTAPNSNHYANTRRSSVLSSASSTITSSSSSSSQYYGSTHPALVCHGKIRRGANYYTPDIAKVTTLNHNLLTNTTNGTTYSGKEEVIREICESTVLCHKCYSNLPSVVLVGTTMDVMHVPHAAPTNSSNNIDNSRNVTCETITLHKKSFVCRKSSEASFESYVQCQVCNLFVHSKCRDLVHCQAFDEEEEDSFVCVYCRKNACSSTDSLTIQSRSISNIMLPERASTLLQRPPLECTTISYDNVHASATTHHDHQSSAEVPALIPEKSYVVNANDTTTATPRKDVTVNVETNGTANRNNEEAEHYTFLTGVPTPVPLSPSSKSSLLPPLCPMATFLQHKVRSLFSNENDQTIDGMAARTLHVRVVSTVPSNVTLHPIIRHYFTTVPSPLEEQKPTDNMNTVPYTAQTILLLQYHDGTPVIQFALYVQQYLTHTYIAYLDSIDQFYFRPRKHRSNTYRVLVTSYLAYTRAFLNIPKVHLWSCPSQRNTSFVFWCKGSLQKVPNKERLSNWYCTLFSHAVGEGVVRSVRNLFVDVMSRENYDCMKKTFTWPVLEGDYWMEEAIRLYQSTFVRHQRMLLWSPSNHTPSKDISVVKATPNAHLLRYLRNIPSTFTYPFLTPVNPIQVPDYYAHITHPMDLGTILSKLSLGCYGSSDEVLHDANLMYENCRMYNGVLHPYVILAKRCMQYVQCVISHMMGTLRKKNNTLRFDDLDLSLQAECVYMIRELIIISQHPNNNSDIDDDRVFVVRTDLNYDEDNSKDIHQYEREEYTDLDCIIDHNTHRSNNILNDDDHAKDQERNTLEQNPKKNDNKYRHDYSRTKNKNKNKKNNSKNNPTTYHKLPALDAGPHAIAAHMDYMPLSLLPSASPMMENNWLPRELSKSIARLHKDFFVVELASPEDDDKMKEYMGDSFGVHTDSISSTCSSNTNGTNVFASRSKLLDFCQQEKLQFDTLRRAKHSSMMLLRTLKDTRK